MSVCTLTTKSWTSRSQSKAAATRVSWHIKQVLQPPLTPDSQSWFHSQEVNLLIDSPEICRTWREALDANQNTKLHGRVQNGGIWRDTEGRLLPGSKPPPNAIVRLFVGVKGAIARVRGDGGFAT